MSTLKETVLSLRRLHVTNQVRERDIVTFYCYLCFCLQNKRDSDLWKLSEYYQRIDATEEGIGSVGNVYQYYHCVLQVCNHPDLFELRPVVSPFRMAGLVYHTASLVLSACSYDPFKVLHTSLAWLSSNAG